MSNNIFNNVYQNSLSKLLKNINMKQDNIEKGASSMLIELEDGNITVTHGTDKAVLFEVINAEKGSWDALWKAIFKLKSVTNERKSLYHATN